MSQPTPLQDGVPPEPAGLSRTIECALADEAKFKRMAEAARIHSLANFTVKAVVTISWRPSRHSSGLRASTETRHLSNSFGDRTRDHARRGELVERNFANVLDASKCGARSFADARTCTRAI